LIYLFYFILFIFNPVFFKKKLLPVQVTPFPEYPEIQAHVKLPTVFVHVPWVAWHPPLFVEHSFISVFVFFFQKVF